MTVKPLRKDLRLALRKHGIQDAIYDKKVELLIANPQAKSLNFEVIQATKQLTDPYRHYSFRITLKYRALCFKPDAETYEVFDVGPHY